MSGGEGGRECPGPREAVARIVPGGGGGAGGEGGGGGGGLWGRGGGGGGTARRSRFEEVPDGFPIVALGPGGSVGIGTLSGGDTFWFSKTARPEGSADPPKGASRIYWTRSEIGRLRSQR